MSVSVIFNHEDDDNTFVINQQTHMKLAPGVHKGFFLAPQAGTLNLVLKRAEVNNNLSDDDRIIIEELNKIDYTLEDKSVQNVSVLVTKQGVVLVEDSDVVIPISAGDSSNFRIDMIVMNHEYVAVKDGTTPTYQVIEGTPGSQDPPALNSPETQTIIGYIRVEQNAVAFDDVKYHNGANTRRAFGPIYSDLNTFKDAMKYGGAKLMYHLLNVEYPFMGFQHIRVGIYDFSIIRAPQFTYSGSTLFCQEWSFTSGAGVVIVEPTVLDSTNIDLAFDSLYVEIIETLNPYVTKAKMTLSPTAGAQVIKLSNFGDNDFKLGAYGMRLTDWDLKGTSALNASIFNSGSSLRAHAAQDHIHHEGVLKSESAFTVDTEYTAWTYPGTLDAFFPMASGGYVAQAAVKYTDGGVKYTTAYFIWSTGSQIVKVLLKESIPVNSSVEIYLSHRTDRRRGNMTTPFASAGIV